MVADPGTSGQGREKMKEVKSGDGEVWGTDWADDESQAFFFYSHLINPASTTHSDNPEAI